jgi:hypothetical protein
MYKNKKIVRKLDYHLEATYIIEPVNKQRKKNRGRKVTLIEIKQVENEVIAKVKYLDTNRSGKVSLSDLNEIK